MELKAEIEKKFDDFCINVSFACGDGSLLALTGPSGAGKTTIIRCIAGLEQAHSGRISYNDCCWYDSSRKINLATRHRQVGYVFQEHTLFPHLTIEKNVSFACSDPDRVTELLNTFGINRLRKRMPNQVSGGERQRAALAQALASSPKVLLLDEPFSALDPETRKNLRDELKEIKSSLHIPVILVTHDLEEANYLADNHLVIAHTTPESCCAARPFRTSATMELCV